MSSSKRRRKWSSQQKLRIVLETLQSDQKLAEICRRERLSPGQVYQWRRQLLASAEIIFTPGKENATDHRLERMAAENQRMKSVIAEITAENLDLKKTFSD